MPFGGQTPKAPRLQLFALAYNLANFLRRLALPRGVKHWSLTTLREKLVKIGAKVTRNLFAKILDRITQLAIPPWVVDGSAVQESEAVKKLDAPGESLRAPPASTPSKGLTGACSRCKNSEVGAADKKRRKNLHALDTGGARKLLE